MHGPTPLVDPWGAIVVETATGVGLTWGEIDLEHLRRVRARVPTGPPCPPAG